MTTEENWEDPTQQQSDGSMMSPPQTPDGDYEYIDTPKPKTWPTVIGIIAIIFGVLGLLGGCLGAGGTLLATSMFDQLPPEQQDTIVWMQDWVLWIVVVGLCGLILGILLLMGGIGLVMRRGWGATTILAWAVLKMLFVIGSAYPNYLMQMDQFDAMQDSTGSQLPSGFAGFMQSIGYISIIIGVVWGLALPVFIAIWFSRLKVKDDIALWEEQRRNLI